MDSLPAVGARGGRGMKLHEEVVGYARNGSSSPHPRVLLQGQEPFYTTNLGCPRI